MAAPYHLLSAKQKVRRAGELPVHDCRINENWREQGIASVLLARRQPDGRMLFGVYLVDVYCMGLKNTFCNADMPTSRYHSELRDRMTAGSPNVSCSVSLGHLIIYGGIEFARQFGFRPHEDFELSRHVLEPRSCIDPSERVEFGRDGGLLYMAGPFDDLARVARFKAARDAAEEAKFVYFGRDLLPAEGAELPEPSSSP